MIEYMRNMIHYANIASLKRVKRHTKNIHLNDLI